MSAADLRVVIVVTAAVTSTQQRSDRDWAAEEQLLKPRFTELGAKPPIRIPDRPTGRLAEGGTGLHPGQLSRSDPGIEERRLESPPRVRDGLPERREHVSTPLLVFLGPPLRTSTGVTLGHLRPESRRWLPDAMRASWRMSCPAPEAGVCRFTYVEDPEGNVVELQSWTE
jgi:hypothetical protein